MRTLEELIAEAADAPRRDWVERYRNNLAEFGDPAVVALAGWLRDESLGPLAVQVIVRAGTVNGAYQLAVRTLRAARSDDAARDNLRYIDDGLSRLGNPWRPPAPPVVQKGLPKGTLVAPAVKVVHHIVRAHADGLEVYGGEAYLFYCGRAFTGGWVRERGGVFAPDASVVVCDTCSDRMRGAS